MKTFEEGDRVSHKTHGEGTVLHPYPGTGWTTVEFDEGGKLMTDDNLLTPVRETDTASFKNGDRVQHFLHGTATVLAYDASRKLVEIVPDGYGGHSASVHPTSLSPIRTAPKFNVQIKFKDGAGLHTYVPQFQQNAEAFLTQLPDWDTVESITITRAEG